MKEDSVISNKKSVQEIYEILKKRDTVSNPLINMMARNLRVFETMNTAARKEIRKQLAEWKLTQPKDFEKLAAFIKEPK